ncbi:MOSC domain-containing protein YiiM [Natronocella acetinitrilica]|uniref:MOSC domain-containing protein YiiM n=1 Tax=Natronocella acetinitrilica TaxID=414046 RepID=A0AAE3KF22_9GAMM|nr:MOSC domain-containing protein [Natronocella acetinitrilica]MCP1673672.1 MOSC domain-containing protein YiiM [Natronocella acetinitrilica]
MVTLRDLMNNLPQVGRVEWIGVRPERGAPVLPLDSVQAVTDRHLEGDRYSGRPGSKRQVTLVQQEHIAALQGLLGTAEVDPALLRRNIAVSGINLLALKDKRFRIGDAVLEYTGLCHPCAKMEDTFGSGGYNAMRGHGGITARIVEGGAIRLGDAVSHMPDAN